MELTQARLRQLQKQLYRTDQRKEIPPSLSEIRIQSLLMNGSSPMLSGHGLPLENTFTDQDNMSLPRASGESSNVAGDEDTSVLSENSSEENQTSTPHLQETTVAQATLVVNSEMVARLQNYLSDDGHSRGAGLSSIFDPYNKSMLLLSRPDPLESSSSSPGVTPFKIPLRETPFQRSSVIQAALDKCHESRKDDSTPTASRTSRPLEFPIPDSSSKSKVDLKFPKLSL